MTLCFYQLLAQGRWGGGKIIVGALELYSLKFHFSGGTKAKRANAPPASPDRELELMILIFLLLVVGC